MDNLIKFVILLKSANPGKDRLGFTLFKTPL